MSRDRTLGAPAPPEHTNGHGNGQGHGAASRPPDLRSVWDFPRPPVVEPVRQRVRVEFAGTVVADTDRALRVCETASPPCYYVPPEDVRMDLLEPAGHVTLCEWKGTARHLTLRANGRVSESAAWFYAEPAVRYRELRHFVAFYPARVDACYVGEARARPQPGPFYGGWITPELVGPFKGDSGTEHW